MGRDIADQIGLVTRAVEQTQRAGKPARVVVASRDYETEIDDLWDAISNPERLPRWFLPLSGELRLGGRYQLQGNAGGTIQTCEPPRHLAVTWEFGGEQSWVDVQLAQLEPERTRLTLRHTLPVNDHWTKFGPGATGAGWDLTLYGLGKHVASAASIDPEQGMAWMVSEEGKRFIRLSSDDWCRADIAAGEAQAQARAAAARTLAAYTGEPAPEPTPS
jgi:uncharacterized protein YndB with AHSA1/START domain